MTGTTHDNVSKSNKSGTGTSDGASSRGGLSDKDSEKEVAKDDEEEQHEEDTNSGL